MTTETAPDRRPHPASRADRVLARYYRASFGWPVTADARGVWLRVGDAVDALSIRGELAVEVNRILVQSLLGTPVIAVPGRPGTWVFLSQERTPLRPATWTELTRLGAGWQVRGAALRLPPIRGATHGSRWVRCPTPGLRLPPWTAVVGAARSASSQWRDRVPGIRPQS